jgi:hypothetical protein
MLCTRGALVRAWRSGAESPMRQREELIIDHPTDTKMKSASETTRFNSPGGEKSMSASDFFL